jgi:hypothetical protein
LQTKGCGTHGLKVGEGSATGPIKKKVSENVPSVPRFPEAIAEQQQIMKLDVLSQEIQIDQTLVIGIEQKLAGISALGHMVRNI